MTTIGVIAHRDKSLGDGLDAMRCLLADAGHADAPWREVSKSKQAPKQLRRMLRDGIDRVIVWGGDGTVRRCINTIVDEEALAGAAGAAPRPHGRGPRADHDHQEILMTSSTVHHDRNSGDSGSDRIAELARRHPEIVTLARAGWAAKGVVYALVGVLAVPIALSGFDRSRQADAEGEASQSGAVAEIAQHSYGEIALWLVAIGLALYVLWRIASIALPASNSASAWVTRAGYLVSAIVYTALAWSAVSITRRSRSSGSSEDGRVERYTRDAMEMSGGRWLVGLVGLVVLGVGGFFVYRGVTAEFRDELEPGGVGPLDHAHLVRLGQIGWVGRGVTMLLVGWFVIRAAIDADPSDAHGIDGALRDATGNSFGATLALVAAVGLIVYGAFCIVSAPRQRLTGAD